MNSRCVRQTQKYRFHRSATRNDCGYVGCSVSVLPDSAARSIAATACPAPQSQSQPAIARHTGPRSHEKLFLVASLTAAERICRSSHPCPYDPPANWNDLVSPKT